MNDWNLPLLNSSLILAADARFVTVDYCDDHIWELKSSYGVPSVLGISTTYGLRARKFIMFPQFSEDNSSVTDPALFFNPPLICFAYPNFAQIIFSPYEGLKAEMEVWIPESHAVWGRIRLINESALLRRINLAWIALLAPIEQVLDSCCRMAAHKIQRANVLSGKTYELSPVVCMRGDVEVDNVPHPALCQMAEIQPGTYREWLWAEAACDDVHASYTLARSYLNRNWEAERARLMMANSSWLDIRCGDPSWDAAFALTQQTALGLFVTPCSPATQPECTPSLPSPSIVLTRSPDQGFSLRGDGTDYGYAWSGQAAMDVYYAASLLLPCAPQLIQGLLLNFFSVQNIETGSIDCRPGLGGQRSRLLATPILANLTWKTYQITLDKTFLLQSSEPLLRFIQAWFTEHDEDVDAAPEWEHPLQFAYADHVVFSRLFSTSQGAQISYTESPTLCVFLSQEVKSLLSIYQELGLDEPSIRGRGAVKQVRLSELAEMLKLTVNSFWHEGQGLYLMRDRDTHVQEDALWLGEQYGNGVLEMRRQFPCAVRLVLRLDTSGERSQRPQVSIYGKDAQGNQCCEELSVYQWYWVLLKNAHATTNYSYTEIERIEIRNIDKQDKLSVTSIDYAFLDLSLFLPLRDVNLPQEKVQSLLVRLFDNELGFWYPFGLGEYPQNLSQRFIYSQHDTHQDSSLYEINISMQWNTLLGEALLEQGHREKCGALVTRLMTCVTQSMQQRGAFYEFYQAHTGEGRGEKNSLRGLAPLGLFLQALGVTLYSPWRVGLVGKNPFPWQVSIDYRGMTIVRDHTQTLITFPDEQTILVEDPAPCIVSLEAH